jgi:hypothetical protein
MANRRKSSIISVAAPLAADYCATDILTIDLAQDDPKRVSTKRVNADNVALLLVLAASRTRTRLLRVMS